MGVSAGIALVMAGLAVAVARTHGDIQRLTIATLIATLVLSNALFRFALDPSPGQTTHVALALVGLGAFIRVRAYLMLSAFAWIGWILAIPREASSVGWGQQASFLVTATALGVILMLARLYADHERERAGLVEEGLNQDLSVTLGWYKTLFNESPALMCIHDASGRIEEVNPAGLDALGYTRQEVVGRNILEFMEPVSPDGPMGYLEDVVAVGRAEGFLRARHAQGGVRIWEYRSTLLRADTHKQVLATATDVTELARAKEAVERLGEVPDSSLFRT